MAATAAPADVLPALAIVLKGYHMGSKWFADVFNSATGSFYFEYEHCLRTIGRETYNSQYAPPNVTLNYLRHSCGCPSSCVGCAALAATPQPTSSADGGDGNAGHRARLVKTGFGPTVPSLHAASKGPSGGRMTIHDGYETSFRPPQRCRATGVSFGALGSAYMSHISELIFLEARIAIVVHVRSNHVKHGLSFLRTTCDGELNHATTADILAKQRAPPRKLRVPPPLLLLRTAHASLAQAKILEEAAALRKDRAIAYGVRA